MNSRFLKHVLLIALFFVFGYASFAYSAISIDSSKTDEFKAPQGSQVVMFYFKLRASDRDEELNSITFTNTGADVNFSSGVDQVQLWQDANEDLRFDGSSDNSVAEVSPDGDVEVTISGFTETITSGNSKGFFLVYKIADDATIDKKTNMTLLSISANSGSSADLSGLPAVYNEVTISGFKTVTGVDISPNIVLPAQEKVAMLFLTITMGGELVEDDIAIKIENDAVNFEMTENGTTGVVKAYLYSDDFDDGTFDQDGSETLITTVFAGDFATTSSVLFEPTKDELSFAEDSDVKLFVVYDIGEDFEVESDSQVKAQLTSVTGTGSQSDLDVIWTGHQPADEAEPFVAGMAFGDLESIIPIGTSFGKRTVAPLLAYSLFAYHTSVTLNTVSIGNEGTVQFIQNPGDSDGVTHIHVYEDSNGNGNYDGADGGDTLSGELELGLGSNQDDIAHIPLTSSTLLTTYNSVVDYPSNNEKRFFVTYTFGNRVTVQTDVSGNTNTYVTAALDNVISSANTSDGIIRLELSGTLPANANPEALLDLAEVNVSISDVEDISPTNVLQGQALVPMLYVSLWADEDIPSATITILNGEGTYLNNSKGVSKVWAFSDDDGDKVLTEDDPEVSATSEMNQTDFANLNGISLYSGANNFIVCYSIGQIAVTSVADSVRAQLSDLTSEEPSVILGGVVPNPENSARVNVLDKWLSIPSVTIETDSSSSTFSVEIDVENTSASTVTINSVDPRFYLSGASGLDISYEFTSESTDDDISFPFALSSGATKTFSFNSKHTSKLSEGTAFIDGFVEYQVTSTHNAVLTRYEGDSSWFFATDSDAQLVIQSDSETYEWSIPNYVDYIYVKQGGEFKEFYNYDAVKASSVLKIVFKNEGRAIDESSLVVKLNGTALERNNDSAPNSYGYFRDEGAIYIWDLGSTDGFVELELQDLEGADLTSARLDFTVSDSMEITEFYIYPSPYTIGENDMILGFNATQPGNFTVYFFNFLGQMVYSEEKTTEEVGYVEIVLDKYKEFFQSGVYIVKVVGVDDNGISNSASTKLAIY